MDVKGMTHKEEGLPSSEEMHIKVHTVHSRFEAGRMVPFLAQSCRICLGQWSQ